MSQEISLKNPPITEALIHFKVSRTTSDYESISKIANELRDSFPNQDEAYDHEALFELKKDGIESKTNSRSFNSIRCTNKKGDLVVQVRFNGLTISKLPPYGSFDELTELALNCWDTYKKNMPFETVERVSARFINKFNLPIQPGESIDNYIKNAPRDIEGLPNHLSNYLIKMTIHDPDNSLWANIVQAFKPDREAGKGCLMLLDNEVFRTINQKTLENETISSYFKSIRELKNNIFIKTLQPEAMELFNK